MLLCLQAPAGYPVKITMSMLDSFRHTLTSEPEPTFEVLKGLDCAPAAPRQCSCKLSVMVEKRWEKYAPYESSGWRGRNDRYKDREHRASTFIF